MGFWSRLFGGVDGMTRFASTSDVSTTESDPPSETFSHDIPTPIDTLIRSANSETSDQRVGRNYALTVPAVLRSRNLMCSIATLPLQVTDSSNRPARNSLLSQINPQIPNVVTLAQTIEDLVFEGTAWWRVKARGFDGRPIDAEHVGTWRVSMTPPPGEYETLPSGLPPEGVLWVDGHRVDERSMIRFSSPNPGILDTASRSIRRAIIFERAAAMYANDPRPTDYFTPSDPADEVDDSEVESILEAWGQARRTRSTAYVPGALQYQTVDTPSPADMQLVEMQKQATIDIANAFGLSSEDLQVSTTSRTYSNAQDNRRDRINDVLAPYMAAITDRLSLDNITRRGYRVRFDLDEYMRADPTTRWNTYQVGLNAGVVSVQEVRAMEGLPPIPVESEPSESVPAAARSAGDESSTEQVGAPSTFLGSGKG